MSTRGQEAIQLDNMNVNSVGPDVAQPATPQIIAQPTDYDVNGDVIIGDVVIKNGANQKVPILSDQDYSGTLANILNAIDTIELTVEDVEEIRVNMADVERLVGGADPTASPQISSWKSTNELLTDLKTLLTTGSSGQELQVDIVAELPTGTKNIGHVDIDTLIPTANLDQKASAASLSTTPATDIADGTYIGDIKFAEELPAGTNNIGNVDIVTLPSAQIGATGAANSMSVTLATDDHLLSTIDQTNDRINVNVDDATSTDGGAVPANGVMIGGTDGTNFQHLKVNTDGELFVNLEAANFNVGDVDIASATFEHIEDAAHTPADKGVHVLAVRKDTAAAQTNADGDYSSLLTDAEGKLHVNAGPLPAQTGTVNIGDVSLAPSVADGATLTSVDGLSVGGKDASGNFQMLDVETNGKLNVVSETASEFKVTEASASAIKDAVEKLDNTVNGSNQLDVNIAAGGFSGAVTGTFWQSTQPVSGTVTANAGSGTQAVSIASMPSTPVTGSFYPTTQNTSQVQSALYTKQYTVTTTAAQAWGTSSQATASGLTVLADTTNTGIVYVGGSTVTAGTAQATDGIPLAAGAAFTFSIDDANKIYAITASGVTGQKLNLVAM